MGAKKVLINVCFGGFGLSDAAFKMLIDKGWKVTFYDENGNYQDDKAMIVDTKGGETPSKFGLGERYGFVSSRYETSIRTNPDVIEVVEILGSKEASGRFAQLKIVSIPDDVEFEIAEYDGNEHIAEVHRTWS